MNQNSLLEAFLLSSSVKFLLKIAFFVDYILSSLVDSAMRIIPTNFTSWNNDILQCFSLQIFALFGDRFWSNTFNNVDHNDNHSKDKKVTATSFIYASI